MFYCIINLDLAFDKQQLIVRFVFKDEVYAKSAKSAKGGKSFSGVVGFDDGWGNSFDGP